MTYGQRTTIGRLQVGDRFYMDGLLYELIAVERSTQGRLFGRYTLMQRDFETVLERLNETKVTFLTSKKQRDEHDNN